MKTESATGTIKAMKLFASDEILMIGSHECSELRSIMR